MWRGRGGRGLTLAREVRRGPALAGLGHMAMLSPPVLEAPERRRPPRRRPPAGMGPPPDRRGGDGGGGGGDGDGGSGPESEGRGVGTVEFAFGFLLIAICTLFGAFLLAWAMLRQDASWDEGGLRWQPRALWLSTALLLGSELAMARTARPASRRAQRRRVAWAAALGLGFLVAQAWIWRELAGGGALPSSDAHGAVFYALTGLHALHVLGGLAFMALLLYRLRRPRDAARLRGLGLCRVYWHVMGALWLVVFTVLYFGG